ncbi:MAG: hypothetical protein OJF50_004036 [Nitrospira sp.]|nr:hypothetical protein [Nitrospira sp.]
MALHRDHEIMAQSIRLCRECAEICKPLLCNGASELVNFSLARPFIPRIHHREDNNSQGKCSKDNVGDDISFARHGLPSLVN